MKKIHFFITVLLLNFFCTFVYGQKKLNELKFIQGDKTHIITNALDSIVLKRSPFAIRYFCDNHNSFTVTRIAVLENYYDFGDLKESIHRDKIPFFYFGTSLAAADDGYGWIVIDKEAHHSLYYKDETDKRVRLISKQKGNLELEWKIYRTHYEGKDVEFKDLMLPYLYFVIFIDNNDDEKIDKKELKIVKVSFQKE